MKEFFKNKRNIAIVASVLALVLAITGVVIYQTNKPEVEDPGKTPEASENVSGEATTEENTADATEESATAEPSTEKQTESTTAKKETSTTVRNKKPDNKPRPTEPKPTQPKPTKPQPANPDIKNPITGEPVPGMDRETYKLATEQIDREYGGLENYKKEVERVKNYKCNHCGKHDCPSINYGKDSFGNVVNMSFFTDKCPAKINHTAKCEFCGKPLGTEADVAKYPDKYCHGNCNVDFS